MASGNFVLDKGYDAAAAITKFRFVKFSAAQTVTPVTGITDNPVGVAQFAVTAAEILKGKGTDVRVLGISEVEAAGAIAVGDMCTLETNGTVSSLVGSSGKRIVGKCMGFAAANAGDRISMLVIHGGGLA
jgi:hypothetical protein